MGVIPNQTVAVTINVQPVFSAWSPQIATPMIQSWRGGGGDEVQGFSATAPTAALQGPSVELRPLTPDDFEAVKALHERNAARLQAAGVAVDGSTTASPDAFQAALEVADAARQVGSDLVFGVFTDGELIGEISLYGVRHGIVKSGFLGAWIDEAHAGQRRVEEAYFLLCRYAFDDLGLNRVEAAVLPENEAVQRALDTAGVASEGLARDYLEIDGEPRDHLRYVFTSRDWEARRDEVTAAWLS